MNDVSFGRLRDVGLREAWAHEAHTFTPWLARNIDHIAEAIGVPLALDRTEVSVGSFYADILAHTPEGEVVLIENQLEQTDHTHLGQIMTYLAGLDARIVVWIAPSFREPHLSAIRWLNQHTAASFSFFALRLRVVRIENSPFAPIFDVVEKPSVFERAVQEVASGEATAQARAAAARVEFWSGYLDRYPNAVEHGITASGGANKFRVVIPGRLILGRYIASNTCGVFLRGPDGSDPEALRELLAPYRDEMAVRLGNMRDSTTWCAISSAPLPLGDRDRWPEAFEFLEARSRLYLSTLTELFGDAAA